MNDDLNPTPQSNAPTSFPQKNPDNDASAERVFEFTSDLNIAPLKSTEEIQKPAPLPPEARPQTPLQEAIARLNMSPKMREQIAGVPRKEEGSATVIAPIKVAPVENQTQSPVKNIPVSDAPKVESVTEKTERKNPSRIINVFDMPVPPTMDQLLNDRDRQLRASIRQSAPVHEQMETGFQPLKPASDVLKSSPAISEQVIPTPPKPSPAPEIKKPDAAPLQSFEFPTSVPLTMDVLGNAVTPKLNSSATEKKSTPDSTYSIEKDPQKPLRTFESDVAEVLARKKLSTASIIIQEKDKKNKEHVQKRDLEKENAEKIKFEQEKKARMEKEKMEADKAHREKMRAEQEKMEREMSKSEEETKRKAAELEKIIQSPPQPIPKPEPIPVPEPETPPEPVPEPAPTAEEISPVHTEPPVYKLENLPFKGVALPTEKENPEPKVSSHAFRKLFVTLISIILVLGGTVGAYILYTMSPLAPLPANPQPQVLETKSLISTDTKSIVAIDASSPGHILSRIQAEISKPQTPNTLNEITLIQDVNGKTQALTSGNMLNISAIKVPDIIKRSLTDDWSLGVYTDAYGVKNVYVIATHNFFQNAFAGMLIWESSMAEDLKQYLTNTNDPNFTLRGHFVDGIVKNKDTREYVSDNGNIIFLYSFIDNNKIVITTNETTLAEIISRLEQQGYMR
jgi:hypothetical protein